MYRQTFEDCVWDCIMKGGHRFECEEICHMNPSSANFYGYNLHSIPTTSAPMVNLGLTGTTPTYSQQFILPFSQ
ncbi:hypothetical protein IKQ_05279 [Bacillus cereus VDM053]|nr:hypothetical protein IKQ_05279 [Bacillus cereus VDM053]